MPGVKWPAMPTELGAILDAIAKLLGAGAVGALVTYVLTTRRENVRWRREMPCAGMQTNKPCTLPFWQPPTITTTTCVCGLDGSKTACLMIEIGRAHV